MVTDVVGVSGNIQPVPGCTWLYPAVPGCTWLCCRPSADRQQIFTTGRRGGRLVPPRSSTRVGWREGDTEAKVRHTRSHAMVELCASLLAHWSNMVCEEPTHNKCVFQEVGARNPPTPGASSGSTRGNDSTLALSPYCRLGLHCRRIVHTCGMDGVRWCRHC
jgi:hypothetical protein